MRLWLRLLRKAWISSGSAGPRRKSVAADRRSSHPSIEPLENRITPAGPPAPILVATPPTLTQNTSAYFRVTEASGFDHVQFRLDGGAFRTMTHNYFESLTDNSAAFTGLSSGMHTFGVELVDGVGNVSAETTFTWTVDAVPPSVQSIVQSSPTNSTTNAASITYTVKFSEPVVGVDLADFVANHAGAATATVKGVTGSGDTYQVTIADSGNGTVGISLVDDKSIHDAIGNSLWSPAAPLTIASGVTYSNAVGGHSVGVGDFNRDGNLDLAFVNPAMSGNPIAVHLGNGNGTFLHGFTDGSNTPNYLDSVTTADLNGDGIDVFLVKLVGEQIQVDQLRGNGDGTFQHYQGLGPSNEYVSDLTIADFNFDGTPDYADVGNAGHVSDPYVLDIVGNVAPPVYFARTSYADPGAEHVIAADLNVDGKPDLLVANPTNDDVEVYLGNGDFTFQAAKTASVAHPAGLAVADVDGDGKPDLIATNDVDGTVSVLLGNGNGTFGTATTFAVSGVAYSVKTVDMNGDGKIDIVVGKTASGVGILLGNGNGSFAAETAFTAVAPSGVAGMAIADLNHDGKPDIVTVSASGSFSVLMNAAKGNFAGPMTTVDRIAPTVQSIVRTSPASNPTNAGTAAYTVTFSEAVTGVDASDFAVATTGTVAAAVPQVAGSGSIWIVTVGSIVGDGTIAINLVDDNSIRDIAGNTLSAANYPLRMNPATSFTTGAVPTSISTADFNSDGKLDVALLKSTGEVAIYLGNGTFRSPVSAGALSNNLFAIALDIDGDGKIDLAVISSFGGAVLLGNGDGTFKAPKSFALDSQVDSIAAGDVNGDGKIDLVTASAAVTPSPTGNISVLLGNGDGTFKPRVTYVNGKSTEVLLADVDQDGKLDALVANAADSSVSVFIGNGDGTFKPRTTISTKSVGMTVVDVNGDGKLDLLTTGGANVREFFGNGDGTFQAGPTLTASGGSVGAVALADMNGDGKPDIVYGDYNNALMGVFLATGGGGAFAPVATFATAAAGNNPVDLAVADLNGDGKPEVLTIGRDFNSTMSILVNGNNGSVSGPTTTIDQTSPTLQITSAPTASSIDSAAAFAFAATDPTAGGVSSGTNRIEVSLDNGGFATATSPAAYGGLADGNHTFQVRAIDDAGNSTATISFPWTIDSASPPAVFSITRTTPAASLTNAGSVVFSVVFDGNVSGVDASDFQAAFTGTLSAGIPVVSGSGNAYTVTIGGITGDGNAAT